MVTVKKPTVDTKTFESKVIKVIKKIKTLDMPKETRKELLEDIRFLHNSCLVWGEPKEEFEILECVTVKAERI